MVRAALPLLCLLAIAAPAGARDSLGVYSSWAAFRDASPARCYAIAKPNGAASAGPFATIATWPERRVRGQLHIRLSRSIREESEVSLTIGERSFTLVAKGRNAWAKDNAMDAAIVAALRSATRMSVSARAENGARFTDRYDLAGVATAIDAALVGCASRS